MRRRCQHSRSGQFFWPDHTRGQLPWAMSWAAKACLVFLLATDGGASGVTVAASASVVCCPPTGHVQCTPQWHVLHGFSKRTQYSSFSTTATSALMFSLWIHAKVGPTPPEPQHWQKGRKKGSRRSNPAPGKAAVSGWQEHYPLPIIAAARV